MRSHTVLLVEDIPIQQYIIASQLRKMGCHVELAATVTEAKRLAENRFYDLILLDIALPDGDGREVVSYIRSCDEALSHNSYIIVQSAHVDTKEKLICFELGVDTVLNKPINYDLLGRILSNIDVMSSVVV